jgi:predicted ATPase/DNA-binding SARP family transcriptional activator
MPDEKNYSPRDAASLGEPSKDEPVKGKTGSLVAFPKARLPKKRPPDNLPLQLSSFVGREREVARVERLLNDDARLVTLAGPGGCGKTRLALAVAQDLIESFEDGVWWVELASLSDPKLVPRTLASALGVREVPDRSLTEVLVEHLEPRKTLLVLDNCEHLVEECAALADILLRACPELVILATSREPLRIAGESIGMVPSLSVPDPGRLPPAGELARYEAVRLFLERVGAVDAGFELTERNASAVARLCRKLDGIPLAIELAAARMRALTVEQISQRLEDPLGLLTTGSRTAAPRHQTLRAALQWSYELLSEQERELLGRLSVFVGGWDLEAAEAVGAGGPVESRLVLDLLSALVDKSLVVAEEGGEEGASSYLRYRMLEPVRQYAREKLEESAEAPEVLRRRAEYYLALAERAEPELLGSDQGRWFGRLRSEVWNLQGVLSWSLESGQEEEERVQELRLRLVAALSRFWDVQGFEEGKRWLQAVLERDPGRYPAARAKALGGLGFILLFQQHYARAIDALEEAIALYKELGDESSGAFALTLGNLGYAVLHGGYRERVPTFVQEVEALMTGDLDGPPRAYLRIILAAAAQGEGNLDSAASQLKEALALARELGDLRNTAMSLFILGNVEIARGDFDRGVMLLEEGAGISQGLGDLLGTAYYVWVFGTVNALRRNPIQAARLWGAAEALRERMGMSFSHFDLAASRYEQHLAAVRSALDEASFEAAWAEGRAMSPEQAIEYALGEVEESAAAPTVAPLPKRTPSAEKPPESAEAGTTTAGLRIFALGPARVEKDGLPLDSSPDWIHKPRELLYYLLCHPEGRTKEQIGLALWPEASTAQLRSSFHDAVYRLRRALGGKEWIVFEKGRYAFDRSLPYSFDVEDFEEHLSKARRLRLESPEQTIRHLQRVVDLYRGDFLEDSAEDEWATERQEELSREYQEALLLLGRLLFAHDRHAEAAQAYRKAIAQDELLEEAHRELMRCHAALGERGRALRHYEDLVELLDEQLGTSPAPETKALHERLRAYEEA